MTPPRCSARSRSARSGAIYALGLLTRHPEAVRGAILHEPPLISVLERPAEVQAALGAVVGESMAAGGPPAALEAFYHDHPDELAQTIRPFLTSVSRR